MIQQIPHINPLLLTRSNKDSFPNGVQDIKAEMKEALRKGSEEARALLLDQTVGSTAIVVPSKDLTPTTRWKLGYFKWKSSNELL